MLMICDVDSVNWSNFYHLHAILEGQTIKSSRIIKCDAELESDL